MRSSALEWERLALLIAEDRQTETTTQQSEADLGMFSMFGRTGAPTIMGPHMRTKKNFCNVPTHRNCPKVIEVINTIKNFVWHWGQCPAVGLLLY